MRALAPWSDLDEISLYGYRTKLIGTNFTYSDNIVYGWPQFAEAAYAYFYYVFEETIAAKFIKVFGLLATANLLGTLLRLFSVQIITLLS